MRYFKCKLCELLLLRTTNIEEGILSGKNQYKLDNVISNKTKGKQRL